MGVPIAIIVIILFIMTMFAVAAFLLYKNRETFTKQTIDPYPNESQIESPKKQ